MVEEIKRFRPGLNKNRSVVFKGTYSGKDVVETKGARFISALKVSMCKRYDTASVIMDTGVRLDAPSKLP